MLALNSFCMFSSNLLLRSIISGLLSKACPEENEAFFFFFSSQVIPVFVTTEAILPNITRGV